MTQCSSGTGTRPCRTPTSWPGRSPRDGWWSPDKDFGNLVYQSGQPHAGVLLLRLEAARTAEKVRVVTQIFADHATDLPGHFSVYQHGRLRIR